MNFPLAARLDEIEPFHVMELLKMAAALEQAGRSVIHMGIGEPDFPAAQPVLDAAAKAIAGGTMRYTHAVGLPALREAIAAHYHQRFGVDVAAERIVITAGASGALLLACAALVGRDDEVLMPDPSYPCNRHFVTAFEGTARLIPSGPAQRFQLSATMVREQWSPSTRGVLLASPSNPTGTSIATNELRDIVAWVRERGGFTVVDEIYQGLSYDAPPFSALSLGEDIIVINSFSKYFNMTGWRLGWLVVPPSMAIFEQRKIEFKRRRDYLVPELQRLGFTIPVLPDGAFYIYADCSRFSEDADTFTRDVLQATGVVMTPGLDFGTQDVERYIRVSYATSMENLQEAVRRLETYLG